MAELVAGIRLRHGLAALGHAVSRQDLHAFRARQRVCIQSQHPGQFTIHPDQPRPRYRCRIESDVEALRQPCIGIIEGKTDNVAVRSGPVGRRDRGNIG
jgi:hypothetical protein